MRMLKRRSAQACILCRERKVRCDVARTGIPCANCARAVTKCSVNAHRKGRLTQQLSSRSLPSANVYTFEVDAPATKSALLYEVSASTATDGEASTWQATPESIPVISASQLSTVNDPLWVNTSLQLPGFIKPLPQELEQNVLQLLHQQAALTLPGQPIIEELLKVYICYVHPLLPLLDLGRFLDAIRGRSGNTISLVLFQAVVFASATFVDLVQLKSMGYDSRPAAREALFRHVKLLYGMDTELDPLTMIQVLLLMTYWYGQQNDTKGRFYWLRTAMSLAMDIGLDRGDKLSATDPQTPFRRRLWYCCIMREKLLSLTERRLGNLSDDRLDVSALQPEDFEEAAFAEALSLYYMPDRDVEASIVIRLCVQKVKLCLIIGRILNSQYELNGLRRVNSTEIYMVLIPKKSSSGLVEAITRDQELDEWHSETASIAGACFGQDHRCNGRFLAVHSSTLEMLYCTAVSMAHRPQLLQDRPKDSSAGALQSFSQRTLRSVARRISEIGRHLQAANLVRFLPPIAVGAFIMSSIQHLKDALSADAELRSTGHLYLDQTLNAFAALTDMYNSADCALGFIERVRSGNLPYNSFEWEDRAESEPCTNEMAANDAIQANHSNAMKTKRATSLYEMPLARQSSGEYPANTIAFGQSSNIDIISEVLLSAPFDASQIEWTSMDWAQPGGQVF